jgi:uncharacterized damage-inducible protein DinB
MDLATLREEYDLALQYTRSLYEDLPEPDVQWRPKQKSSAIAWHLGHQAAVNHFLLRNLFDAEPSIEPHFDVLFDAANPEENRGDLPPLADIEAYRQAVAARTHAGVEELLDASRAAPVQRTHALQTILINLINHEYQHDCWIGEMRQTRGYSIPRTTPSQRASLVDGYWMLSSDGAG